MPLAYVRSAARWAKSRGLPLDWVLATILVESGGNPRATGDEGGRSVGLMQVNSVAHAAELKAAGLSRESLFDPETNIQWGTLYMRAFRDDVQRAGAGRPLPADLGELMRLSYKGPAAVLSALRQGKNPLAFSWAPDAIANWRNKLAYVHSAEARGKALAGRRLS